MIPFMRSRRRVIASIGLIWAALAVEAAAEQLSAQGAKIRVIIDGQPLIATMIDNSASRDFLSRLPLKVELSDYANNEKIFYPKPKLDVSNVPEGMDPQAGDITYYAPWGDVAIFYRNFRYSSGLVPLGRFDSDATEHLSKPGSVTVRFERAN